MFSFRAEAGQLKDENGDVLGGKKASIQFAHDFKQAEQNRESNEIKLQSMVGAPINQPSLYILSTKKTFYSFGLEHRTYDLKTYSKF